MAVKTRVQSHRKTLASKGLKRVEVSVPTEDAARIAQAAKVLRLAGDSADRLRAAIDAGVAREPPKTGAEVWARLRGTAPFDITPYVPSREIEPDRPDPFE